MKKFNRINTVNLQISCRRKKSISTCLDRSSSKLLRTELILLNNVISNGNRTEWSPIRSVMIRMITKSEDRLKIS